MVLLFTYNTLNVNSHKERVPVTYLLVFVFNQMKTSVRFNQP
jgi:hypothetical protein